MPEANACKKQIIWNLTSDLYLKIIFLAISNIFPYFSFTKKKKEEKHITKGGKNECFNMGLPVLRSYNDDRHNGKT